MICIADMTKTEAARILVTFINVRARHYGVTRVTKDFIELMRTEALAQLEDSRLQQAAALAPHWTTIRTAGRRVAGH